MRGLNLDSEAASASEATLEISGRFTGAVVVTSKAPRPSHGRPCASRFGRRQAQLATAREPSSDPRFFWGVAFHDHSFLLHERGDLGESPVDRLVGSLEHAPAFDSQVVAHASAISGIVLTFDQASADQAVDYGSDARPADGEAVGESRGGSFTLVEVDQDSILRERQVDFGERQFDLAASRAAVRPGA